MSLKRPRGDIYRRPRNDQNALLEDERSLCRGCHFRGWTTAADQPRQARDVSVVPLPRLIDRGTWTAAPLRGFCRHSTAAARPRHFMRGSFGGFLSLGCCLCTNRGASGSKPPDFPYLRFSPKVLQLEPKYPCCQKNLQKPPKKH